MADIDLLLDQILHNRDYKVNTLNETESALEDSPSASRIYTDEPIIFPGDRKIPPTPDNSSAPSFTPLPEQYRNMKKMARRLEGCHIRDEALFYEQGKYMEDFEDHFDYHGHFSRYFPTYQSMSDEDLRGYFSWRTRVRHGQIEGAPLSFAFVYIYELLNQIGTSSPLEGYHKLKEFQEAFASFNPGINRYLKTWLWDYVIYYQLDPALLADSMEVRFDQALLTLRTMDTASPEQLFLALNTLSTHNLEKSKLYRKYPEDVTHITCKVFERLCQYYEKNRSTGLFESLFGNKASYSYFIFNSAVFYGSARYDDYTYTLNDIHSYRCQNGRWRCEKYYSKRKNPQLGAILKTVDSRIRQKYSFKTPLQPGASMKYLNQIIDKEIDSYLEEKKLAEAEKKHAEAARINIDLSKLSHIRQAASIIQDKLIVDEDEPLLTAETVVFPPSTAGNLLNAEETAFLRHLLIQTESGADPKAPALDALLKEKGILPSVLVDNINEKLWDSFEDTVILYDGDRPELIEDYIDDIKEFLKGITLL